MRKKNILLVSVFALTIAMLPACDLIEECGTCRLITEDASGNIIDEGTPLPYCGDDLKEKENASPVTVGGVTTYWDCY
jgi:hypothetical protein